MHPWLKGIAVGVAIAVIGVVFGITPFGTKFEKDFGLHWLFKIRGPLDAPRDVAVVAINGRTAKRLGLARRPRDWPRSIHARLIENLVSRGAAAIVFDLDFQHPKLPKDDLDLANAIARSGRVVLTARLDGRHQPIFNANGRSVGSVWVERLMPPIPPLAKAAKGIAPFPLPKLHVAVYEFWAFKPSVGDAATSPSAAVQVHNLGVYDRWREFLVSAGVREAESLPKNRDDIRNAPDLRKLMESLRAIFRNHPGLAERIDRRLDGPDGASLSAGERRAIRGLAGLYGGGDERYLNFYGPPGSIETIPFHVLIKGADPSMGERVPDLTGRIVYVGYSDLYSPEQPDRFFSVFTRSDGVDLSGVEIAATGTANLLSGRSIRAADPEVIAAILFIFGFILGTLLYLVPSIVAVPVVLVLAAAYGVAVQLAFNWTDSWFPLATPIVVQLPMALFVGILGQYLLEREREKRVSAAIANYLPESAVRELMDKRLDPNSLNRVVQGVCLATDMSGFTSIAEQMPPKDLAVFMNSYFDELAAALKKHDVDVTEFHADTIMCAWTDGQLTDKIHHKAALAGLEVLAAVDRFNQQHARIRLYPRVGIEEGAFYLGNTGGGGRMGYSILGDCANTAARLETLNKQVGTHVLAAEPIVRNLDDLLLRPLGRFNLVGKTEPISVVEICVIRSLAQAPQLQLCERFAEGLDSFRTQNWARAIRQFEGIVQDFPDDGPTQFYLAQCRDRATDPVLSNDPDVIRLDTK